MTVRILQGDCRDVLRTLPANSVHCTVTSPPYFGLRSYLDASHPDKHREIGSETTPDAYVATMVEVFRELRRVLRDDGTLWINLGDSYVSSPPGNKTLGVSAKSGLSGANGASGRYRETLAAGHATKRDTSKIDGLKPKDLIGIPWRVALALQADGWWLRQDNIWSKRSCMPESVRDRTTRSHEYLFMLTKSPRYYYDAVAIEEEGEIAAGTKAAKGGAERAKHANGRPPEYATYTGKRNKRSVWWLTTEPFPDAHFAVMPTALVEPCILAGTSERGCCAACGAPWVRQTTAGEVSVSGGKGARYHHARQDDSYKPGTVDDAMTARTKVTTGWSVSCTCDAGNPVPAVVLDPFGGAGTVALVADRLQRDATLIDLNPQYAEMQIKRIRDDAGLFATVTT